MIGDAQQRIRVEGFSDSDTNLKVAIIQLKTGQVFMKIEGCDPSIENLVHIRQMMDSMVKEIDKKLPQLVIAEVEKEKHG